MAKGCIQHAIEVDTGSGWQRTKLFRATPEDAKRIFERESSGIPIEHSVRLAELVVLEQRNGKR